MNFQRLDLMLDALANLRLRKVKDEIERKSIYEDNQEYLENLKHHPRIPSYSTGRLPGNYYPMEADNPRNPMNMNKPSYDYGRDSVRTKKSAPLPDIRNSAYVGLGAVVLTALYFTLIK